MCMCIDNTNLRTTANFTVAMHDTLQYKKEVDITVHKRNSVINEHKFKYNNPILKTMLERTWSINLKLIMKQHLTSAENIEAILGFLCPWVSYWKLQE